MQRRLYPSADGPLGGPADAGSPLQNQTDYWRSPAKAGKLPAPRDSPPVSGEGGRVHEIGQWTAEIGHNSYNLLRQAAYSRANLHKKQVIDFRLRIFNW